MSGDLLNVGLSGLRVFQRQLTTTSHNIANVNTEGYSRQRVDVTNQIGLADGAGFLGAGAEARATERLFNQFVNEQVRSSASAFEQLNTFYEFAAEVDNRLADPAIGLTPGIQDYFESIQGWSDDPASIPARQVVLSQTDVLVNRFHALDDFLSDQETRINGEIQASVTDLNALASSLAKLNADITRAQSIARAVPNDLLDQRDQVIRDISKRLAVTVTEQDDGQINVLVGNGQALVLGNNVVPLGIASGDFDPTRLEITAANVNVTSALVGGELGGLLDFRSQVLEPSRNALGRIAVAMADDLNTQNRLGLDLDGNLGGDIFVEPTPQVLANNNNTGAATVTAAFSDTNALQSSDYRLRYNGGTSYTLTRLTDNQTFAVDTAVPATLNNDGFTLTIGAGAAVGDTYEVRPVRTGAEQIDRAVTDVRRLAASGAVSAGEATDANGQATNTGTGVITQPSLSSTTNIPLSAAPISGNLTLTFNAGANQFNIVPDPNGEGPLAFNPATDADGRTFTLTSYGGMSFTLSGTPANGDSFVIGDNSGGVSDNRNALALASLQTTNTMDGSSSTYQAAYGQLVSQVGSETNEADINRSAQKGILDQAVGARETISGVNLDEEAANLVRFQQAYQASAQVVSVANTLFDSLLGAIG